MFLEAIQDFNQALTLNPNYTEARTYLNKTIKEKGLIEAREKYDEALNFNPNSAVDFMNRGKVKSELGDYLEAVKDL